MAMHLSKEMIDEARLNTQHTAQDSTCADLLYPLPTHSPDCDAQDNDTLQARRSTT